MARPDSARRRLLLTAFVVSGFTGLIYESIWSHYLKLFLGHAAYAQALVLAIFMGGLALGSWLVARYSSRTRHLLWGYVFVEGLIGVLGLCFHQLFTWATDFSFVSVIPALPIGWPIHLYKWSLGALLVLPQSVLLGMTFPLISGGLIRRWPERPGETLSILYFTNSLGAAFGVLVGGFVLIGSVGLPGTILTAGLLNIALALAVWSIVRGESEPPPARPGAASSTSGVTTARWFLVAAFLTGAASFMYELGWIRMLSLVLGSSTHSFELMLSAFILGLAFGGLYVRRRIERTGDPQIYLGMVMLVMGSLAALTLPAYNHMFDLMAWALRTFTRTEGGYVVFNLMSQAIAALIMVPVTFCAGMTLPLLTHALMRQGKGEPAIGTIYSVNTLGAIVGVLLTVHVLMPSVGVKGVILAGAAIHIGLGLSRLIRLQPRPATVRGAVAASVVVLTCAVLMKPDPLRMASGVYRTGFATVARGATVSYLRDGKTATISLAQQAGTVVIATNGKPDAALQMGAGEPSRDEVTMVLAAAIPLSMHQHPARVANIGFGSGLTTHTLLTSDEVKRVDSVEIEPLMVEAARRGFGARIHDVFEDSRSHIVYEDAKTFFAATREPYDLIVSEPSNPWVSGVASLFSDEFYGRVRHYLRSDGYLVQWLQIYETDIGVVASVLKALAANFATYAVYNLDDSNVLIVATRAPALGALSGRLFHWPRMRAELDRIGIQSVADLQQRRIGDNRILGPLLASMSVPRNSDFFPFVDLNAARLRYLQGTAFELPMLTSMPVPFLELLSGTPHVARTAEPSVHASLHRDSEVRRALAIQDAVVRGGLHDLDTPAIAALLLIDMSREKCADPAARNAWLGAVRRVSDWTADYLTPVELAPLWSKVAASPCYRALGEEQRAWTDLFAALAQRNAAEIARIGVLLLQVPASSSPEQRAYLATVTAAAQISLGQDSQAGRLLLSLWDGLDHSAPYGLPLQELLAVSRWSGAEALALRTR